MPKPAAKKKNILLSVVIPGHNRPNSLRETLAALNAQSLSSKEFEIIVVGFEGTSLQALADEFSKIAKPAFVYKEISTRWPDAKRNEGIRLARGDIVAFTDDDVLPDKDWLKAIKDFMKKNPEAAGVEGLTDGDNTPLLSHATKNHKGFEFPACNYAFRKDILEKIGGFDEAYHFFREDTDLAYKALQHGTIPFEPSIKVFHPTRSTSASSILRELGMTRGEIRLAKKFPNTYAKRYGFVGRGGWKQALLAWVGVGVTLFYLIQGFWLWAMAAIAILYYIRHNISFRGRTYTFSEALGVFTYMGARDLAYPFFFAYYWFTENPLPIEKPGQRVAL